MFRPPLLPPRIDPVELVALGETYARATGYPIQYQWTLIEGVNDSADEIEGIVRLLAGKYAVMNMIPFNTVDGLDFRRPSAERAAEIARGVDGVRKVVRVFEVVTEEELSRAAAQQAPVTQDPAAQR